MDRKFKLVSLFSLGIIASFSLSAHATPIQKRVMLAPLCLVKHLNGNYKTLSSGKTHSLIEVDNKDIDQLITAKNEIRATACGGFVDVTVSWNEFKTTTAAANKSRAFLATFETPLKASLPPAPHDYRIQHEKQVTQLLADLNPQNLMNDLTTLTSAQDRYANSKTGVEAANWIKGQVEKMAQDNHRDDVTVYTIATNGYDQPSVVAKIGKDVVGPGIVVGAHMDTLRGSASSKKPGADDDGSGTVTVLEVARRVLASGMTFKKPIYFIWYAAEEEGLVGSGDVVRNFKRAMIPVDAVLHFDMTGYSYRKDTTLWLLKDNVNKELTSYLATLIKTYVKQPIKYTSCGYDCSDHATWDRYGFPAAIAFESAFSTYNQDIHTSQDTIDKLSLTHMTDFAKLGVAFAVELAEPVSA